MGRIFITSDDHFYHKNIIRYCDRPWNDGIDNDKKMIITDKNVLDMNESLINNWNSVVNKDDIVINLGDFCFGVRNDEYDLFNKISNITKQLNGEKYLLLGNHDRYDVDFYLSCGFKKVYDKPILWNDEFFFSHRPLEVRNGYKDYIKNAPFINVFGHIHNSEFDIVHGVKVPVKNMTKNTYCCCVELTDYKPVLLSSIPKIIQDLQ